MGKKKKNSSAVRLSAAERKVLEKKKEKRLTFALLAVAGVVVVLVLILLLGGKSSETVHRIEIDVENYGTIKAEVDESIAPVTVENFLNLARSGFYDGLTFHRIISGFMIQGGDATGTDRSGSAQKIKGEFAQNGFNNTLSHKRGVLSMARSSDFNSASSQFFIMHQDTPSLDGKYAAFGWVTEGMEIVDAICENTPVQDSNGSVLAKDRPIITAIRVLD